MAKTSAIEKNRKRTRMVKKYALRRQQLKAIAKDQSLPGEDRFVMVVYESDNRCYELDFSNHTTGYCEELRKQLIQVVNSQDDIEVQSLLL